MLKYQKFDASWNRSIQRENVFSQFWKKDRNCDNKRGLAATIIDTKPPYFDKEWNLEKYPPLVMVMSPAWMLIEGAEDILLTISSDSLSSLYPYN